MPLKDTLYKSLQWSADAHYMFYFSFKTALEAGDINIENYRGDLPINGAARLGLYDIVQMLIPAADITRSNSFGNTSLHDAINGFRYVDCSEKLDSYLLTVQLILQSRDIAKILTVTNKAGDTPLSLLDQISKNSELVEHKDFVQDVQQAVQQIIEELANISDINIDLDPESDRRLSCDSGCASDIHVERIGGLWDLDELCEISCVI